MKKQALSNGMRKIKQSDCFVNRVGFSLKKGPRYFFYSSTLNSKYFHLLCSSKYFQKNVIMQNKRLSGILLAVALLLLIPFIAMQFTDEVKWTLSDFVVVGGLLLGTGLMCELVIRKVKKIEYRIAICGAILAAFFLIWLELAVGIFGTPFAGS